MKRVVPWICPSVLWLGFAVAASFAAQDSPGNRFQFKTPRPCAYWTSSNELHAAAIAGDTGWLKAWRDGGPTNATLLGSHVVAEFRPASDRNRLTAGRGLVLSRTVAPNVFILQAPDALTAAREAQRLAALPEVLAAYPVMRQPADLNDLYAPRPSDSYFAAEWELEHRNGNGSSAGVDLNVRAAWPFTTGQGVTVAVADTGIEMNHVELARAVAGGPHHNFQTQDTNGAPVNRGFYGAHGTEVAGLIAAQMNNARIVGVAPGASLASWVIYDTNLVLISDEQLMDMYEYDSNGVSVQNHSWGHLGVTQDAPTLLEQIGLSNAVSRGRSGRGVIMVRSAGNDRSLGANADDDGYPSDPRVIAVAAINVNGRAASYSEPGACVLVGAPSGDPTTAAHGLFTTDLIGADGANPAVFPAPNQDLSDYMFYNQFTGTEGFNGTSAAAPQVAGVAALMLSVNPKLTWRDVQQILILACRHFDFADPDVVTNGAGFVVSHNDGFGVPDAGVAVSLARDWVCRPAPTSITLTATNAEAIPDDGLRLWVTGDGVPAPLASIRTKPDTGPHADAPTRALPLVDVGMATNAITINLTNKAALILRGTNTFADKINRAAQAGAAFAVVYNYSTNVDATQGGDQLTVMAQTDFVPIPAVFIGNSGGEALKAFFRTNSAALAQIHLQTTDYVFTVTNTLLCEHVGVRVMTDHERRGDLRITLVSPAGTRSILQQYNQDASPGPTDWTYYSTHHFFESSAGNWTVCFSDEEAGYTGAVQQVSLIIEGTPIADADHDGLDDNWELEHFASLAQGPKDDPDHDGYSNMREQIMGSDPNSMSSPAPLRLDLSVWSQDLARLSWPGSANSSYEIWSGTNAASLSLMTKVPGHFPVTEWFAPYDKRAQQFFEVRAIGGVE